MHHDEHLFNNFGRFFVVDAIATAVQEGCSADAVVAMAVPAVAQMQNVWGLQYRCSVGSGRVSNSTDAAFVQWLVGSIVRHQQRKGRCYRVWVMLQHVALLEHIPKREC